MVPSIFLQLLSPETKQTFLVSPICILSLLLQLPHFRLEVLIQSKLLVGAKGRGGEGTVKGMEKEDTIS